MKSIGTNLREAREKQGFTLDGISAQTRITVKCLAAIERDDANALSSPFLYKSFVRQYAEQLHLDFSQLTLKVDEMVETMRQPDLPGQGEHQPVRVAPIQARVKRDFSWLPSVLVFVGAVIVISGGYAVTRQYKTNWLSESALGSLLHSFIPAKAPAAPQSSVSMAVPSKADTPVATEAQVKPESALPPSSETVPSETSVKPDSGIHLELAAVERTWLSATADGKKAYSGILEPEQVKVLDGQETAQIRTGNAAGVSITFNGKPIGAIGPRGTTRTVVFTKTSFEVFDRPGKPQFVRATRIGG